MYIYVAVHLFNNLDNSCISVRKFDIARVSKRLNNIIYLLYSILDLPVVIFFDYIPDYTEKCFVCHNKWLRSIENAAILLIDTGINMNYDKIYTTDNCILNVLYHCV